MVFESLLSLPSPPAEKALEERASLYRYIKWNQNKKIKSVGKQGPKTAMKFSNNDRVIVTDYFKAHPFTTTPLPPGIAKNLARGKPLPPGIAKVFLPEGLLSTLPAHPGYDYLVAGNDVLLVNSTTGIVSDILTNVLK